jgi:hypothetical protein
MNEIRQLIAKAGGKMIQAGPEAERLAAIYPDCGMSVDAIAHKIIVEAAAAGVPIQASRPARAE